MRISDWSSDVCSSDLDRQEGTQRRGQPNGGGCGEPGKRHARPGDSEPQDRVGAAPRTGEQLAHGDHPTSQYAGGWVAWHLPGRPCAGPRSEEHTSELQSLMRISYAVFCLQKKITQ